MAVKCATFWDDGRVWPELEDDDIRVENHHSQARLIGLTDDGKTFLLDELKNEGCQWMDDALWVEPPKAQDIVNSAKEHGLNIEVA